MAGAASNRCTVSLNASLTTKHTALRCPCHCLQDRNGLSKPKQWADTAPPLRRQGSDMSSSGDQDESTATKFVGGSSSGHTVMIGGPSNSGLSNFSSFDRSSPGGAGAKPKTSGYGGAGSSSGVPPLLPKPLDGGSAAGSWPGARAGEPDSNGLHLDSGSGSRGFQAFQSGKSLALPRDADGSRSRRVSAGGSESSDSDVAPLPAPQAPSFQGFRQLDRIDSFMRGVSELEPPSAKRQSTVATDHTAAGHGHGHGHGHGRGHGQPPRPDSQASGDAILSSVILDRIRPPGEEAELPPGVTRYNPDSAGLPPGVVKIPEGRRPADLPMGGAGSGSLQQPGGGSAGGPGVGPIRMPGQLGAGTGQSRNRY